MAIMKCWECEKEVSNSALSCPNCGAILRKRTDGLERLLRRTVEWPATYFLVLFTIIHVTAFVLPHTSFPEVKSWLSNWHEIDLYASNLLLPQRENPMGRLYAPHYWLVVLGIGFCWLVMFAKPKARTLLRLAGLSVALLGVCLTDTTSDLHRYISRYMSAWHVLLYISLILAMLHEALRFIGFMLDSDVEDLKEELREAAEAAVEKSKSYGHAIGERMNQSRKGDDGEAR